MKRREVKKEYLLHLQKWLKKVTRPRVVVRVSEHKDEVRSIPGGYFRGQFRVSTYKLPGRPTNDVQKRKETLEKVTNNFMDLYMSSRSSV
jgi:hypothetical protein